MGVEPMIDDLVRRLNSPIKHPQDSVNQRQEAAWMLQDIYKRYLDSMEHCNKHHINITKDFPSDYTEGFEEGFRAGKLSMEEYPRL
jgi:hypothetical protein